MTRDDLYDGHLFTPNDSKAVENLVTALAVFSRERDGSPCFCVRLDSVDAEGFAVDEMSHQPRCRSARITLFVARGLNRPKPSTQDALDVEALAEALHPHGKGPVVDCCMGSTTRNVHGEDEGERIHRGYHHDDAVALATEYAAILAARGQQ